MSELQILKKKLIEQKKANILKFYQQEMKPFIDENSIPSVPKVSEEMYNSVIIPAYIKCGAIPKSELIDGHTYKGSCRNASEAIWNSDKNKFTYIRYKFGTTYPEDINHFEDDDGYDLFVPIKDVGMVK